MESNLAGEQSRNKCGIIKSKDNCFVHGYLESNVQDLYLKGVYRWMKKKKTHNLHGSQMWDTYLRDQF